MQKTTNLELSKLGKAVDYQAAYDPDLLFPIARKEKRDEIGLAGALPFYGFDLWNHYEVSWLNEKGKPIVAIAEISYDAASPCIIESKSLKLYFNSFNQTIYKDVLSLQQLIENDLSSRVGASVVVKLKLMNTLSPMLIAANFAGVCLDDLDVECRDYSVRSDLLKVSAETVSESVYSHLLKSNCLVTNQPDWGSVWIDYTGPQIDHARLLQYLVSFRLHNEFHEQCIERIFMDIMQHCHPQKLTVYGRYTRRGGLDINPYRSTEPYQANEIHNLRLIRQ